MYKEGVFSTGLNHSVTKGPKISSNTLIKIMKLSYQISFLAVLSLFVSISEAARSSSSKHGISYGSSGLSISYPGNHGGKIWNFRPVN